MGREGSASNLGFSFCGVHVMRANLTPRRSFSLRPSWVIHYEDQSIPVVWSSWYCQQWIWPSGETYQIDFQHRTSISRTGEVVATRRRLRHCVYAWEGALPLVCTWRHSRVYFRRPTGELVMYCRSCLWGARRLVIRSSVDRRELPVLFGIAMATFLNFH